MKLFTRKEKLSSGITCLATSDKYLYVGSTDDALRILDRSYKVVEKLKVNFGTVDAKSKNDSFVIRARCEHV